MFWMFLVTFLGVCAVCVGGGGCVSVGGGRVCVCEGGEGAGVSEVVLVAECGTAFCYLIFQG